MKKNSTLTKITFLFLFLTATASFGQTWDIIDNTGYGTTPNQTFALQEFQGNFYAAAGRGNGTGAHIYSSPTGDPASWTEQPSFLVMMGANDYGAVKLSATNAAGGWMAAGTKSNNGPGVYHTADGSNWSSMGSIPYPNPLIDYGQISSLSYFNPAGADDTLYAAVENWGDGAEIWKIYAGGGTWSKVFDFPSSGAGSVLDMIKFNNKLYACTSNALIYESTDGNNWTMNIPADTGFNQVDTYCNTSMTVFQNKLYVATSNYTTGPQLWCTSDGLTWSPVMLDGFGVGSDMDQITDMMVAAGKLWTSSYAWISGALMPDGGAERGAAYYTYIYNSSDGSSFTNLNNDGFGTTNRWGNLGFFKGFVYQGSDNTGWGNGELWRICTPPTPSISPINSSVCEYAPVYYADTLSTASSYEWYVDGVFWSSATNFTHNPNTVGVQTIKLIERNGTCADSVTTLLTVYQNPTSTPTSVQNYCAGTAVVLYDTITGGTAPYVVTWDDEMAFNATGDSIIVTASTSFFVYANATDANGCSSGNSTTGFTVTASTDLVGHAGYSGGNVSSGNAVAYKYYGTYTYFDTIQVAPLAASGNFIFTGLNSGDYLIKIFADTLLYPTLNATYFGDTWAWDTATVVSHGCSVVDTANITMIEELGLTGGPGNLRGRIVEDLGFGGSMLTAGSGGRMLPGEPIPGIDVKLGKNPGGAFMGSTTTSDPAAADGGGYYYFTNIPLNSPGGSYTIYVDIPGLERDSSYTVVLDPVTYQYIYLDYIVDSTSVYIVPNAGVGISNPAAAVENKFGVYPNPFKGTTNIEYHLAKDASVSLEIFNVVGEKVKTILNEKQQTGDYKYPFATINAGVYFVVLNVNGNTTIQRVVQVK